MPDTALAQSTPQSPQSGQVCTITVMAPVPDEHLPELTTRLTRLVEGPSPFRCVPSTHFARLVLLPRKSFQTQHRPSGMGRTAWLIDLLTHAGRSQRKDEPSLSYLLFTAAYDGDPGDTRHSDYVGRLRLQLGAAADDWFGLCSDYPGCADPAAFGEFFAARTLPAGYVFRAFRQPRTVGQTRDALRLRDQVIALALSTQGLDDADLARRLREAFSGSASPADPVPAASPTISGSTRPTPVRTPLPPPAPPVVHARTFTGPPATEPDLSDVQNLVTSGYAGHQAFAHLMLAVTDPAAARRWLAAAADAVPSAGWAHPRVHRLPAKSPNGSGPLMSRDPLDPPGLAVHVAFSYSGLTRLGLSKAELAGFPDEFRAGMAAREAGLTPGRGTSSWQPPFAVDRLPGPVSEPDVEVLQQPVDVLVMLSAADQGALSDALTDRPWLYPGTGDGFDLLARFDGGRIRDESPGATSGKVGFREHFGFVDGLSQPRIHGVTVGPDAAELPAGEALLGYRDVDGDTAGNGLDPALAKNGSFLVYRKLHQDVAAFRDLTAALADQMAAANPDDGDAEARYVQDSQAAGGYRQQLAAAKLMGRWPDGTPLTLSPERTDAAAARGGFDFQDQDSQGLRCPVGAHIRRANPRDSRPVDPSPKLTEGGDPDLEVKLGLRHRMLRRGVPYGRPLPIGQTQQDCEVDDGNRGLLFIALVGDLKRQFEFVQARWLADGNSFRLGGDRDLFCAASLTGSKFTIQGKPPTFIEPDADRPLVTCLGGEYFFLPGITALKRIASEGA